MLFKHIFIVLLLTTFFNLPLAILFVTLYATTMNYLALTLPGGKVITAPGGISQDQGGIAVVAKIVGNALTILLIAAVILTLVYLLLGGVAWIHSGGDKQKLSQARSRLTYAIIGLVVALASFFILNVIGFIFKVNLLQIG
jgi:Na+/serine symporter